MARSVWMAKYGVSVIPPGPSVPSPAPRAPGFIRTDYGSKRRVDCTTAKLHLKPCARMSDNQQQQYAPPPPKLLITEAEGTGTWLLPRVTIRYCTQCKWMLRAAYFAQELLTTFSTVLGEVALQPATGGVFAVHIHHKPSSTSANANANAIATTTITTTTTTTTLWDRRADGGFPEIKELKRRVRDVVEPDRNLGHVDRAAEADKNRQPDSTMKPTLRQRHGVAKPPQHAQDEVEAKLRTSPEKEEREVMVEGKTAEARIAADAKGSKNLEEQCENCI